MSDDLTPYVERVRDSFVYVEYQSGDPVPQSGEWLATCAVHELRPELERISALEDALRAAVDRCNCAGWALVGPCAACTEALALLDGTEGEAKG